MIASKDNPNRNIFQDFNIRMPLDNLFYSLVSDLRITLPSWFPVRITVQPLELSKDLWKYVHTSFWHSDYILYSF